jgi:hypothetical protein
MSQSRALIDVSHTKRAALLNSLRVLLEPSMISLSPVFPTCDADADQKHGEQH